MENSPFKLVLANHGRKLRDAKLRCFVAVQLVLTRVQGPRGRATARPFFVPILSSQALGSMAKYQSSEALTVEHAVHSEEGRRLVRHGHGFNTLSTFHN